MRLRHESNKEKENSIDQDQEEFNVNCSLIKGRKDKFFMGKAEEQITRASIVLLGLRSCKKEFSCSFLFLDFQNKGQ